MTDRPTGVLLLQLGTPDSTSTRDVRRYLREFLSDPRVLDMSAVARRALLELVILPFRPRRSAHAYRQIWTDRGSPLLALSNDLVDALSQRLGPAYRVALGMRYQNPPIAAAVTDLLDAGCERLVLIPLFPQYSSAATGSAVQRALDEIGQRVNIPAIAVAPAFYDHPGFVEAQAALAAPMIEEHRPDHVLFSYHGLPEKQIRTSDTTGSWCLASENCSLVMTTENRFCYRAQSHATTRAISESLGLEPGSFSTAFQSRLAGQKWIEPYTDRVIVDFAERGIRRLAVLTPSFTTDCLETLEEIGIRLRNQWADLGGESLALVPCVNTHPLWVDGLAGMVESVGMRA
ncbi:MAG TPA: ferrochelatase [Acidimicrobiia bacterium]|nr:ferrochelatase [Acidimicrobiia bacterium]